MLLQHIEHVSIVYTFCNACPSMWVCGQRSHITLTGEKWPCNLWYPNISIQSTLVISTSDISTRRICQRICKVPNSVPTFYIHLFRISRQFMISHQVTIQQSQVKSDHAIYDIPTGHNTTCIRRTFVKCETAVHTLYR